MSEYYTIIFVCCIGCIFCVLLKQYIKEYALMLSVCICVTVLLFLISEVKPVVSYMSELFGGLDINILYFSILLKAIGICYVTKIGENICKDSGENALAVVVQMTGRISVSLLSLPVITDVFEIIKETLK